jgi:hypothetical protein
MKSQAGLTRLLLIGMSVLLVAALVIGLRGSGKNWNWYLSYSHEDNNPYGLTVLYNLLPGFNGGELIQVEQAPASMDLRSYTGTFFSVGHQTVLSVADLDSLAAWAAQGNTVFLALETLPGYLPGMDSAQQKESKPVVPQFWDSIPVAADTMRRILWHSEETLPALRLNFANAPFRTPEDHKLIYQILDKAESFPWTLMQADSLALLLPGARALGSAKGNGDNLVEVPLGQGRLLLFSTPMALANFSLVQPDGRDYAERVLSHTTRGDVLWDAGVRNTAAPYQPAASPLSFVLSQPPLRWAWYLLLLIGLLFLVFRSRRRQAAIPPLNPKKNQSLEYLNTVAQLHYQQRSDHRAIGEMLREQFLGFLRERFHLRQPGLTDETAQRLSGLLGLDQEVVRSLFSRFAELETSSEFNDYSLLRLHRELRQFYEKCT